MAHPAGIIAAGQLNNPVKYAHVVTSTTHKRCVVRGGIILMGKILKTRGECKNGTGETRMMSAMFDSAVSPVCREKYFAHVIAARGSGFP